MQHVALNTSQTEQQTSQKGWAAPYRAMSGALVADCKPPRITLSPIAAPNDCIVCCVAEDFDLAQYHAKLKVQYKQAGWPHFTCDTQPETEDHRHVLVVKDEEVIGGLSFSIAEGCAQDFLESVNYGHYIPQLEQQIDLNHTAVLKGLFLEGDARGYLVKNAFWQFVYTYVLAQGKAIALIEAPTLPRRLDVYYEHNGWIAVSPTFYNPAGARWPGDNKTNARLMARPLHGLIPIEGHSIREIDSFHRDSPEVELAAQHA
ncbi:MAG: hypothetical protein RIC87_09345 [Kiloniellales bacterium]